MKIKQNIKRIFFNFLFQICILIFIFLIFLNANAQDIGKKDKFFELTKLQKVINPAWEETKIKDKFVPGELIVKFKIIDNNFYPVKKDGKVLTGISTVDALNKKYGVSEIAKVFKDAKKSTKTKIFSYKK